MTDTKVKSLPKVRALGSVRAQPLTCSIGAELVGSHAPATASRRASTTRASGPLRRGEVIQDFMIRGNSRAGEVGELVVGDSGGRPPLTRYLAYCVDHDSWLLRA